MPLRYLFVDMNAFFASVEQQADPALRGRPVAVVPVMAESTSCIAASYEAKAKGVKTGTPVWEARRLCPGIAVVEARPREYVIMHNRIVAAVGSCLPVDKISSVDEMSCKLTGDERHPARATALGRRVKDAILATAGDYMRCSVGVGSSAMLAKVAADMQKPDGLVALPDDDMPAALHRLKITDFPGIGPRMERRFNLLGIFTASQLCAAPMKTLAAVWGSRLIGEKWFRLLRGEDVPDAPTRRQTIGHSHVLPPDLRTDEGAYGVLVRLVHKAAARLRHTGYWAGGVSVGASYAGVPGAVPDPAGWGRSGWGVGCKFGHRQDTPGILRAVAALWRGRPAGRVPCKVGMVLTDLRPTRSATPSLFDDDRRQAELSHAMDDVNTEFGASVVYFGSMFGLRDAAPMRVAFNRIPDLKSCLN